MDAYETQIKYGISKYPAILLNFKKYNFLLKLFDKADIVNEINLLNTSRG